MTDWRALCEELADALACHYPGHVDDDELVKRARAALAETVAVPDRLPELRGMFERILCVARSSYQKPVGNIELADRLIKAVVSWAASGGTLAAEADGPAVPEGREPASVAGEPSDEELAQAAKAAIHEYKYPTELVYFLDSDSSEYEPFLLALRAAIAADRSRFGRQPAPPAEGEVGELVSDHPAFAAWLAREMPPGTIIGDPYWWAPRIARRAADLLEQCRPAPVPVAIPGEEYHEDMGAVTWWRFPVDEPPWVGTPNDSDWPGYHTHFTPAPPEPAHALPLPAAEVQP